MRRVVISTIGTSLLTNQINRSNPEEKDWYSHLRDTANLTEKQTPDDVQTIIAKLKERASKQLKSALDESKISTIRRASAELNGIYGIYQENLAQGREDINFLIATDLLDKSNGDTSILKQHGGIQYDKYTNKGNIEHFRVTQGTRVSNIISHGKLVLRRYGSEPEVNSNP